MKTLESIFKAAKADLANYMTAQLQANATQSNWDDELIQGMNINYDGSAMTLEIADDVYDNVMTQEFGTERVRPTSVIRRTANQSTEFEQYFIKRMDSKLRRVI